MVFATDHSKRLINTPGLGFADLPNQIYRRAVKVKFLFFSYYVTICVFRMGSSSTWWCAAPVAWASRPWSTRCSWPTSTRTSTQARRVASSKRWRWTRRTWRWWRMGCSFIWRWWIRRVSGIVSTMTNAGSRSKSLLTRNLTIISIKVDTEFIL